MAKSVETIPADSIEMPPNKAIAAGTAAGGSMSLSSVVVALAVYYAAPDTPAVIVGLWDALAAAIFGTAAAFAATYWMPHGAIVKND